MKPAALIAAAICAAISAHGAPVAVRYETTKTVEQLVISSRERIIPNAPVVQHVANAKRTPNVNIKNQDDSAPKSESWTADIEQTLESMADQILKQNDPVEIVEDLLGETVSVADPVKAGLIVETRYGAVQGKILKQWDRVRMFLGYRIFFYFLKLSIEPH